MQILKLKWENFKEIVKITTQSIKEGKVIICPTDTVYGLICDATNKKAVNKNFKIKERPETKPIPIFVRDLKQAKKIAKINKKQEKILKSAWPGKVTIVFERKKIKTNLYGLNKKTIALRIPKHKLVLELLKKIDKPLTGTSANISSHPPSTKIKEVLKQFALRRGSRQEKYQPDLVIDAGNLPKSRPSLVIDLTKEPPKILRT